MKLHFIFYLCVSTLVQAQNKYDYTWLLGIDYAGSAEGAYDAAVEGSKLDFSTSPPTITSLPLPYYMTSVNVVSDGRTGELLYYSNGCSVMTRDHVVMDNGDDLNSSVYQKSTCYSGEKSYHADFNGSISVPIPYRDGTFCIIHRTKAWQSPFFPSILYSIVDMNANHGQGRVTQKNQTIVNKTNLAPGYLTACKSEDGSGWWVLAWESDTPKCYTIYIDSSGVALRQIQTVGDTGPYAVGQAVFSPDGKTYMWYDLARGVHIYDFDRATGLLSRHRALRDINEYYIYGRGGVTISPSGRFAYLSALYSLYQLDLSAADPIDGLEMIDTIDYVTRFGIRLDFANSMLAPDCKVYISTGFAYYHFHVIHQPDLKGRACQVEKMAVTLPWPNDNSAVPNNPHYRMDQPRFCDPLMTSIFPESWYIKKASIYPNPADGLITITSSRSGTLSIYDVLGHRHAFMPIIENEPGSVDIHRFSPGLYFCTFVYHNGETETIKFVKQ